MNKLDRSTLFKFLRDNRWAWTPVAVLLMLVGPVLVVIEHWDDIKGTYLDLFKVMFHQVDSDK
tara:strand:+ start:588 stop:776 length:189 start_codon:yes stop_codon:yes gene_type:complete